MLRTLLSLVTSLAVCWHTVGGCSGHHAHDGASHSSVCAGRAGSICPGHSHTHHHHGHASHAVDAERHLRPTQRQQPAPCPLECCEGTCAFAILKTLEAPAPEELAAALAIAAPGAWQTSLRTAALMPDFRWPLHGSSAFKMRRHLALGVLLI